MKEKVLRYDLAFSKGEQIGMELYEDRIKCRATEEKAIEIAYRDMVSCKRYIRELYIISKGISDGVYGNRYISFLFDTKETAAFYYQFIYKRVSEATQLEESDEDTEASSKPVFTFASTVGLTEGNMRIYNDKIVYSGNLQDRELEVYFVDVRDVIKSFGCIRVLFANGRNLSFQVPKALFQSVMTYLQEHVRGEEEQIQKEEH